MSLELVGALLRVHVAAGELGRCAIEARTVPLIELRATTERALQAMHAALEAQAELNDFFARECGLPGGS